MSLADSAPRHVYRVGPWRRWLLAWVFGPVLFGALVMGVLLSGEGRMVARSVFLLMLPIALMGQWLMDRSQLEVSAAGVVLRQTGYLLESPWANIEEMRLDRGLEAFITREAAGGRGHELLAASAATGALPAYDQRHLTLLNEHRLIPFEAFAWHLRHGELRWQIESYAPHLRASLTALDGPATEPPVNQSKGRKWTGILLFVALIAGIGWLVLSPKVNRPLVDTAFGTLALIAATIQCFYSARDFLRRRLWIWGGLLVILGMAIALWALGVAVSFFRLLGTT